ncbi:Seryl-tRNA synthetase [Planoprotostelium fungivorum]|uniref:serine--tRNA ligase n=1 Tax=Planoprotostelium fungivorum TaxID=1890364 RepID=A0A2P6N0C0_9EUKA|nr:Seryl-tRNA synthetase [Planoprotostelium fungivorum]
MKRPIFYWNQKGHASLKPVPNPQMLPFERKFMADYNKLREEAELISQSCRLRGVKNADVHKVLSLNDQYRLRGAQITQLNTVKHNDPNNREEAIKKRETLSKLETERTEIEKEMVEEALKLPNLIHPHVTHTEPKLIRTSGEKPKGEPLDHVTLGRDLDLFDFHQSTSITAEKFVYLKNEAAILEMALIHWAMTFVVSRGFTPVLPPDLIRQEVALACGFSPKGEKGTKSHIYSIEDSDLCLTGTAEIPLTALYANRVIPAELFPIKMVGFGHCFRMEPAANRGLYRLHQFSKVEMVNICLPEQSERQFEEMLDIQEELYSQLGLHYRVLDMPPDDLGAPAYRKFDIEAWMPHKQDYGEISSLSNCTDYQSRRLAMRYKDENKKNYYPHTLNGTALAVPRVLLAIMENCQSEGVVHIPQVLHPYTMGLKEIKIKRE